VRLQALQEHQSQELAVVEAAPTQVALELQLLAVERAD
jgi:hypothetical protein